MIEVENLSKTYYVHRKDPGLLASLKSLFVRQRVAKVAVDNVSFSIGEGEIVGLVGANGAGKTTLVKMLAGIVHPTSGTSRVLGYDPWRRDQRMRRQIALIMGQKAQLWWDLPAADSFLLLKEIYQIPDADYHRNLARLTSLLGVEQEITVQIRRLSLGERMKMELIAALLHSPRVVYLDEPTIGLDLTAQRMIRDFILQYREEYNPAMIVTSHYMDDIEKLCRRILILRDGELVYDGGLREVVDRYANEKIITAHLHDDDGNRPAKDAQIDSLGEVLEWNGATLKVAVDRRNVTRAAGLILERFRVADLSIEEIEIGALIERIQTSQGEGA